MAAPTIRNVDSYSDYQKYSVNFFEENFIVTVTATTSVIRRWIRDVIYINNRFFSHPLVVGVGVQWTPFSSDSDSSPNNYYARSPPASYDNSDHPVDTLQLSVGKKCLIIQLRHCDRVPNILRRFLRDPRNKFVGVWNSQDAGRLARSIHRLEIEELLDIRLYAKDSEGRNMRSCSFEEIVEKCMGYRGVRLDQQISVSDWSDFNLDDDQILQASLDAYVCHMLGVRARVWQV